MELWHITFAGVGRQVLFADETSLRAAVRTLARIAGPVLVLFAIVDEHLHVIVIGTRAEIGRLKRALLLALRPLTATPIDPGRPRPVEGRRHMISLVTYLLEQPQHHGLTVHPATYTGSCFADLIGARAVPGMALRLGEVLPRFRLRVAYRAVGLPDRPLEPVGLELVRDRGAARLAAAASAALASGPDLEGRSSEVVCTRNLATVMGTESGIHPGELARVLGVSQSAVRRARQRVCSEVEHRAVLLFLALEEAAAAQPRLRDELAG